MRPLPAATPGQVREPTAGPLQQWPLLLLLAAALGLARREWRARRTLAGREQARDPALLQRARALAGDRSLAQTLRLSTCAKLSSPLALGLREVVLPQRTAELSSGERDALLAHELAHLVRRDPLWLGLGRVLSALFWFQPLHALLMRELENQSELAADAWAVNRTVAPLELARSLERVGTWLTGEYAPAITAALRPALGTAAVTGLALAIFACAGPAVHETKQAEIIESEDTVEESDENQILIDLRVIGDAQGGRLATYEIQGQTSPSLDALGLTLKTLYNIDSDRTILIHAHPGSHYDEMDPLVDAIVYAGFTNLSIVTNNDGAHIATTFDRTGLWVEKYEVAARLGRIEQALASIDPGLDGQRRVVLNLAKNGDSAQLPRLTKIAEEMRHGPIPHFSSEENYPLVAWSSEPADPLPSPTYQGSWPSADNGM